MATKATPRKSATLKVASSKPARTQTTLVPSEWGKKAASNNTRVKPKSMPNGNIMTFFKRAEELNSRLFLEERGSNPAAMMEYNEAEVEAGWTDEVANGNIGQPTSDARCSERRSNKKRKLSFEDTPSSTMQSLDANTSPKPLPTSASSHALHARKRAGPFVDDSESEVEEEILFLRRGTIAKTQISRFVTHSKLLEDSGFMDQSAAPLEYVPPILQLETAQFIPEEPDDFEGLEDDDFLEGEEFDERRWMQEQRKLEMAQAGFKGDMDDSDLPPLFSEDIVNESSLEGQPKDNAPCCPICNACLLGLSEREVSAHANACLDGDVQPLPHTKTQEQNLSSFGTHSNIFKSPERPARHNQQSLVMLGENSATSKSAFSKLMSGHAEDTAWVTAAAVESAERGKPSYQRTCPFYKILPGFYICVDAFRYGAVKGQKAYFLSHFHSDHYIGLTATWSHGPIYCSKVTANLVRQQLRVDPKWIVDLDFEKKTEIPGTEGVYVTMISANHCPGSSLFLFEKEMGKGQLSKLHRVLHCGDFRACQAHLEHPLLKPEVMDAVSGKSRQQKLDVCYLDTTYLNPKYAFPPQEQVIQACADMCVSLNKEQIDENDSCEQIKKSRTAEGMVKFIQQAADVVGKNDRPNIDGLNLQSIEVNKKRGRLLVVVGTYSIGKERICIGIAQALGSKIYAPPSKQRICRALEDPELNGLLTNDPREAQVHMTPLFEIRAETLDDYLRDYSDHFCRCVGFRPSGWNYRPPKGRLIESPSVQTVLHSETWKSTFTMRDLAQQRGSTNRTKCFGVPYSEHSSFRELTMFCCALRIDKIIPTVNVGSAKSREKMKVWCDRWVKEKKKNGLFRLGRGRSD